MPADDISTRLLASARRALVGQTPQTLRALSVDITDTTVHFRAFFSSHATEDDVEFVSRAATEVIADFPSPFTIHEEFVVLDAPAHPENLRYVVYQA